ncbi:uncharacterized protein LOC124310478 [Neodiprion virginianus]|uniref:uncharacterized protein LOC124310478 n=1 Tax=Neodiprion virginianus TaxID=2961670 RepID=UPI001EE76422|nr:uncharacterized protein LOC124310478 [Neodiprion virginianus]
MSGLLPLLISIVVMWLHDSNCASLPEKSEIRVAVGDENSETEDAFRELEDEFMRKIIERLFAMYTSEESSGNAGKAAITDSLIPEALRNAVKNFTQNVIDRDQLRLARDSNSDPKFFSGWVDKFFEFVSNEVPHDPVDFERPTTTNINLSGDTQKNQQA